MDQFVDTPVNRLLATTGLGSMSVEQLLTMFREERNGIAFRELHRRYGRLVQKVCIGVLGNSTDAEEASQETWITFVKKADSIWSAKTLAVWFHRTAWNQARTLRRKFARRRNHEEKSPRPSPFPPPEEKITDGEVYEAIHCQVQKLPRDIKNIIIMRYFQGLPPQVIAENLGHNVQQVYRSLKAGRERLRTNLTRVGIPAVGIYASIFQASEGVATTFPQTTVSAKVWLWLLAIPKKGAVGILFLLCCVMIGLQGGSINQTGSWSRALSAGWNPGGKQQVPAREINQKADSPPEPDPKIIASIFETLSEWATGNTHDGFWFTLDVIRRHPWLALRASLAEFLPQRKRLTWPN